MASSTIVAPEWAVYGANNDDLTFNNPEELGNLLDFSYGARRLLVSSLQCSVVKLSSLALTPEGARLFTLAEDCAYVLATDFPEEEGKLPRVNSQSFATPGFFGIYPGV